MAEDNNNASCTVNFRDLAGALFRGAVLLIGFFAANAWNQLKDDIAEVKSKLTAVRERVDTQSQDIAVIQSTTKRTEALVAEDGKDIKDHERRLSKVENRCCK
mgnify:CR=1 FL=1